MHYVYITKIHGESTVQPIIVLLYTWPPVSWFQPEKHAKKKKSCSAASGLNRMLPYVPLHLRRLPMMATHLLWNSMGLGRAEQ